MTTLGDPMSNQEWQSLKEEGIVKVEPDGSVNYEQFLVNLTEELGKDMDDGAGQSRGLPDGASS